MKNILCYGDSNTWGNIAGTFNQELMLHQRFPHGVRWPTVLQQILGAEYYVIEAGLNGRNTSFDEVDTTRPSRNGLVTLPGICEMHYPLDLVVFMLGTNDIKIQFNASLERITQGMRQLVHCIKKSHFGPQFVAPQVMIIVPAPIFKIESEIYDLFFNEESIKKSQQLASHYAQLAAEEQCSFLDAGPLVKIAGDGIHIAKESQVILAKAVAEKILAMDL